MKNTAGSRNMWNCTTDWRPRSLYEHIAESVVGDDDVQ